MPVWFERILIVLYLPVAVRSISYELPDHDIQTLGLRVSIYGFAVNVAGDLCSVTTIKSYFDQEFGYAGQQSTVV